MALMRAQFRIGSGLCWAAALMLAVAAPAVYLLAPGDVMWWVVIPGLVLPLVCLIDSRAGEPGVEPHDRTPGLTS